ncbi:aspartyl-phosphate phosphatase Spo0E family protein [Anaerosolibacter sp.]|uniref:aspartyl-phosphate phosphatase Spo0E family protein n=1 Tax=Anaerosolibacter sp. TaxID=1872527 RepID=UPI0039F0BC30
MDLVDSLVLEIEYLRSIMHELIEEKQDLLNSQVLSISQEIDILLNQLHEANTQGQN